MEKLHILTADILDILFDGRNKNYGAYQLRKTYGKRLAYALSGTVFICLLFVASSLLANAKKHSAKTEIITTMELENFKKEEPKQEPPKPLPKPEEKIEMVKNVVPRIVLDEEVTPEDELKPVEEMENVKIGNIDQEGIKEDVVMPPVEKTTGVVEAPKKEDDIDKTFTSVQIEAKFPGGMAEWTKYLERNLNKDIPSENGAPAGDYGVIVSFIVNRNGVISEVRTENDPGYGTKAEAIRVIQKGPNWIPAEQNGRAVVYRQKQKITFRVANE